MSILLAQESPLFWGLLRPAFIRDATKTNVLMVAPPRSGKTATLIANCLHYPGSILVADLKGAEVFFTTARYRHHFNDHVYRFDPYRTAEQTLLTQQKMQPITNDHPPIRMNPFDLLDPNSPTFLETIDLYADALVVPQTSSQPYFQDKARSLIKTAILYLRLHAPAEEQNPGGLYRFFRSFSARGADWLGLFEMMLRSPDPLLASRAYEFVNMNDTELKSVESSLQLEIEWLGNPILQDALSHSDLSWARLKTGTTLYLILPTEVVRRLSRLLRLFFAAFIQTFIHQAVPSQHPALLFLDEFPLMGNLGQRTTDLLAVLPGFGLRTVLISQTLAQIQATYEREADALTALCATQVFLNVADIREAERVAKLLGKKYVPVPGAEYADPLVGAAGNRPRTELREILRPEQIRAQNNRAYVFATGQRPRIGQPIRYFKHPYFRGKYDPNPLYATAQPKGLF